MQGNGLDSDERLNVPKETLLGAANSALSGGILSLGVSAIVSVLKKQEGQTAAKLIMQNIKGTHYLPIVAATAAFTALGATVRFTRASRHNGRVDREAMLQEQQHKSYVERVEDSQGTPLERMR